MASSQVSGGLGKKVSQDSSKTSISKSRKRHKARQDWEIVEGLKEGQICEKKPDDYKGYLMKRRRWPLKGWHKVGLSVKIDIL